MKQFTNLYPVSKTLRFELQPIGKTKENIEKNGIHGRVFKDSKFIGYAPEKKSFEEILIAVDMMI